MLKEHTRLLLQSQLEICWNDAANNKRITHKLRALLALVKIEEPAMHELLEATPVWKNWDQIDSFVVPEHVLCEAVLRKVTELLFEHFDWDNDSEWVLRACTKMEEVTNRIMYTDYFFVNRRDNKTAHLGQAYIDNFHGILKESLRLLDALDCGVDPHDMAEKGI